MTDDAQVPKHRLFRAALFQCRRATYSDDPNDVVAAIATLRAADPASEALPLLLDILRLIDERKEDEPARMAILPGSFPWSNELEYRLVDKQNALTLWVARTTTTAAQDATTC